MTPQQFGFAVNRQLQKQALFMIPMSAIGGVIGGITAPTGHASGIDDATIRAESIARGAAKGGGLGAGATLGAMIAGLATRGKLRIPIEALTAAGRAARSARRPLPYPRGVKKNILPQLIMQQKILPRAGGTVAGGLAGFSTADAILGQPSWETKK